VDEDGRLDAKRFQTTDGLLRMEAISVEDEISLGWEKFFELSAFEMRSHLQ
jgi:hypothetical protein